MVFGIQGRTKATAFDCLNRPNLIPVIFPRQYSSYGTYYTLLELKEFQERVDQEGVQDRIASMDGYLACPASEN